jgi:surface antigen
VLALALAAGGCAATGHLGSLFSSERKVAARADAGEDVTGSVARPRSNAAVAAAALPTETDLVFARMAIVEVLGRGSKDISVPWENPSSGARGTVTPIASAYARDGATCHDFLASYLRQGAETWLQGEACRESKGRWEVKSLRPWTRS